MLLEAVADDALADVVADELVAVLHRVDEFIRGDEGESLGHQAHDERYDDPHENHVEGVLRQADCGIPQHDVGVERQLQFRRVFSEHFQSVHETLPFP